MRDNKMPFRTIEYTPVLAQNFGNTKSCHTLARLLNEEKNGYLNRKVAAHIGRFFKEIKSLSEITNDKHRRYIGSLILKNMVVDPNLQVPELIGYVIRNVKIAYVKDMLMAETPKNYTRRILR